MNEVFPIWLIALDYFFAIIMLILIINFILNLFFNEGSNFYFFRFVKKLTTPILNFTSITTPNFIVKPIIPLYLAWLIFMLRIYFFPLLNDISSVGKFAFVFEKDVISFINTTMLEIALYLNYGLTF